MPFFCEKNLIPLKKKQMKKAILLLTIGVFLISCASKRTKIETHTLSAKDSIRTETAIEVVTEMVATFTGGEPLIIDTPKGRTKISGSGNVIIQQTSNEKQSEVQVQTKIEYRDRIKTVEKKSIIRWWWLIIAVIIGYFVKSMLN